MVNQNLILINGINPKGVETSYFYDFLRRPVRKAIFSSGGDLLSEESFVYKGKSLISKTDAEGFLTTYEYDGEGRKIVEERAGEKTSFTYDSLGRLHTVQRGDLIVATAYDLLDRVVEERSVSLRGELLRRIRYEYDEAGNQKTIIRSVSGEDSCEKRSYDSLRRLVKKIDPLGNVETIDYNDFFQNDFGQKVLQKTRTDPLGLKTIETFNTHQQVVKIEKNKDKILSIEEKTYNLNDLLTFQTDTIFSPSFRKIHTRWIYDSRNRLKKLTEADGAIEAKTTRYDYTLCGELAQTTKPSGTRLVYDYNDLGFLISLTSSDGTVQHRMDYNRLGHLIRSDDLSRTVDARGRILAETFLQGCSIENAYDDRGRREKTIIPEANCLIKYDYNAADLKRVSRKTLDGTALYTHAYVSHDLSGNLLESALIGHLGRITYSVDPLSRKTQIIAPYFLQKVEEFDPAGNIRRMKIQNDDISYSYDELYQMTFESSPFIHEYRYDPLNNRLQKDGENYRINDLNQDLSHFAYDPNGNPTLHRDQSYTYDALDRLTRINTPSFSQIFQYDSFHRCLAKTISRDGVEEIRYFLYDGQNEIGSFDEHLNPIELRILGNSPHAEIGAAVAIELRAKPYAPIHDLQGNVVALIPLSEEEPTFYRYSAFGEEKIFGSMLSPWRFSSKRSDAETGLVYYGRRFYNPEFGRWLTPDPSGFTDGMNLYAFVHNDPLTHFDEYGLLSLLISAPSVEESLRMGQSGYPQGKLTGMHGFVKDAVRSSVSILTHIGRDPDFTTARQADFFADQTARSITRSMTQCFSSICPPQWDNPHFKSGYNTGYMGAEAAAFLAMNGASFVKGAATALNRFAKMPLQIAKVGTKGARSFEGALKAGKFTYTDTAAKHFTEFVKKGPNAGRLSRPYMKSQLTIEEIMTAGKPVPDPGGIPGGLRWDVPGTLRGSKGTWELVIHSDTNVIYHFNFK